MLVFKLFFNWKKKQLPNQAEILRRTTGTCGAWVAPGDSAWVSALFPGFATGHRAAVWTVKNSLKYIGLPRSYPGIGMIAEWQWSHN